LRDYLSTAPALPSPIRDAQDRASTASIEDQVRLLDQVTDIGTGVMAGHGMMSVAEEGFSIFGRHAGGTRTAPEGVPQVVDTDAAGQLLGEQAAMRCCPWAQFVGRDKGTPRSDRSRAALAQ
jgi:hypothetical protein